MNTWFGRGCGTSALYDITMGLYSKQLTLIQYFHSKCCKRRKIPKPKPVNGVWDCVLRRPHTAETFQGLRFISLLFVQNADDLRPIKAFMNLVTAADKFIAQTFFF